MRFYNRGDRIFMIGFSRGAFTARVLSGMIERVGLLCPGLEEIIPTAWNIYKNWEYAGQPSSDDNNTLADEVNICQTDYFKLLNRAYTNTIFF